jgi:excisionase family DNA binding protein
MTVEIERATYTIVEAAKRLGISRNKAYRDAAAGRLPAIRLGRTIRVSRAAIDRLLGASGASTADLDRYCDRLIAGEKGDYQEALTTLQKLLGSFDAEAHKIAGKYDASQIDAALKRAWERYKEQPN